MKPWEKVTDPNYFRKVLGQMVALGFGPKHEGKAHVRFGGTGGGHAPNYQIEDNVGTTHCFRGMSHDPATLGDDAFAEKNLSEERFTYAQVQAMLARLLR
jgi:hypothetical protein